LTETAAARYGMSGGGDRGRATLPSPEQQQASMDPKEEQHPAKPNDLLAAPPRVINVGLAMFAENLANAGGKVVHVRWSPPAGGNARLAGLLSKLRG